MTGLWTAVIVAQSILVVILAVTQIGIIRQLLPLLSPAAISRAAAPSALVGAPLPGFEGRAADGTVIHAADLAGQPFLLLFVSQNCEPCIGLLRHLAGSDCLQGGVRLYTVLDTAVLDTALLSLPLPAGAFPLLERGGSISRLFRVDSTPFGVAVDSRGLVVGAVVPRSTEDIRRLVLLASSTLDSLAPQ